jgi:hypothetical protein
MKIGMPQSVVDLYEWLPGYGESGISVTTDGLNLRVTVCYEREGTSEVDLMQRELTFIYARYSCATRFQVILCLKWLVAQMVSDLVTSQSLDSQNFARRILSPNGSFLRQRFLK